MAIVTSRIISNTLFCWKKKIQHMKTAQEPRNSPNQKQNAWHLSVQKILLRSCLQITDFVVLGCPIIVLLSDMAEGLLHVISNASVQWSLFSVKSNYPHKKEPRASRLARKVKAALVERLSPLFRSYTNTVSLSTSKRLRLRLGPSTRR